MIRAFRPDWILHIGTSLPADDEIYYTSAHLCQALCVALRGACLISRAASVSWARNGAAGIEPRLPAVGPLEPCAAATQGGLSGSNPGRCTDRARIVASNLLGLRATGTSQGHTRCRGVRSPPGGEGQRKNPGMKKPASEETGLRTLI
jgi:hypothetical protein